MYSLYILNRSNSFSLCYQTGYVVVVDRFYNILRSRADPPRSHVILHECLAFYSAFLNIHLNGVLTELFDYYMVRAT